MNKKYWLCLFACLLALPLLAESYLSANDLQPAQLTAATAFESFTILATPEKGVTIEAMDPARSAEDGEVFNLRIKLNGGGSPEFRAISFNAADKAELLVYLASSSKTDARILRLVDSSGALLAELSAPPDDGLKAGMASFILPAAGDYLIFSAASGINIYQLVVK